VTARGEVALSIAVLGVLGALLVAEGRRRVDLERRVPVEPREVYRTLARSQTAWQVVDVRPDLSEGYEESHVPGALPMPGCDPSRAPEAARARILLGAPTVVVAPEGDPEAVRACLARFASARAMAGGMDAWSGARLPEDSGAYSPPSAKAGGGCL
jgi:rhodanese-related sulfurtransferase